LYTLINIAYDKRNSLQIRAFHDFHSDEWGRNVCAPNSAFDIVRFRGNSTDGFIGHARSVVCRQRCILVNLDDHALGSDGDIGGR
jgi:hypothetical protein